MRLNLKFYIELREWGSGEVVRKDGFKKLNSPIL